jgi:hypothetical protein
VNSFAQESGPSDDQTQVPADLAAVFRHAMELAPEIDQAWSLALSQLAADEEHEDLRIRWSLTMDGLTAVISEREKEVIQRGIDPRHFTWPLGAAEAVKLDLQPDDAEVQRTQLEDAQLLALDRVIKIIGSFLKKLLGEEVEEVGVDWWESGAFSLARLNAALALRITRELDGLDASQRGDHPSRMELMRSRAFEALESATAARDRGDPEATLLHCVRSARARIASLSLDGKVPPSFVSAPSAGGLIPVKMLALAEELLQCEIAGTEVHPGASTVLAENLVIAVEQLVLNPPVDEVVALINAWSEA